MDLIPVTFKCDRCFQVVTEEMHPNRSSMVCCNSHRRPTCIACFEECHPYGVAPCIIDWSQIFPPDDETITGLRSMIEELR